MDASAGNPVPETGAERDMGNWIGITVALLSAFMAVTKVKDDNIVQAMMQAKSDAVDTWSEYQAKKIKQHLVEIGRNQAWDLARLYPGIGKDSMGIRIAEYSRDIQKYAQEEKDLQAKAKAFESRYDELNTRDDQFDLSDASLSISLGVLGIAALTRKKWLLGLSWLFGAFGLLMGLAGLSGWTLHPAWLVKLLS
jgi:hypothetical protein